MTIGEIYEKFTDTIDQYYQLDGKYVYTSQLHFVGGVLQSALHILPFEKYHELKKYIYETYGYDPGGVSGQLDIMEYIGRRDA